MGEKDIAFALGITKDGRVLVDFNMEPVDHLKMTPDEAEEFGAYLIQTAKEARGGKVIMTPFSGL